MAVSSNMKRILQVMKGMSRDGLETFVMNVYRSIDRKKVQFDFLVFIQGEAAYDKEILSLGGEIFHLPARSDGYLQYIKALDDFFRENAYKYSAIHQHADCLGNLEQLMFAKKYGIPIRILHSHNSTINGRTITKVLHYVNKLTYKNYANKLCACSEKAAKWFYGNDYAKKGVSVIHNGIDTEKFMYKPDRRNYIRELYGVSDNEIVLGHVGRFTYAKNHRFLVRIANEMHNRGINFKFFMLGSGEEELEIKKEVEDLGLNNSIIFTGNVANTQDYYSAMDVFVMPSFFEGLPVVLVEAQAAGLPCVISDTISRDSKLTDHVFFESIDSPEAAWVDRIISVKNNNRVLSSNIISQSGYGAAEVTRIMLEIYGV